MGELKTRSIELNERELAVIQVSLTLRSMYFPPLNRNDRIALKSLIKRFDEETSRSTVIPEKPLKVVHLRSPHVKKVDV